MAQMIQRGRELVRINIPKNTIEYSPDGGRNWNRRCSSNSYGNFKDLIDYGNEILACTSKGIYYSKDDGRNWSSRYIGSSYGDFIQLTTDGSTILANTSKGLYYSKDGGRNWHKR